MSIQTFSIICHGVYPLIVLTFTMCVHLNGRQLTHTCTLSAVFVTPQVGAMKWRKSVGLNGKQGSCLGTLRHVSLTRCADIKFEEIDEELWRSGMAQNHGLDRDGNNISMFILCSTP